MSNPMSTALIPYTPPLTPDEYLQSERKRLIDSAKPPRLIPGGYHSSFSGSTPVGKGPGRIPDQGRSLSSSLSDEEFIALFMRTLPDIHEEFITKIPTYNYIDTYPSTSPSMIFDNTFRDYKLMPLPICSKSSSTSHTMIYDGTFDCYSSPLLAASSVSSFKKLNGDEIAEVLQSQAGFTVSTDTKPVLATYGCGPCVAVGGYDPTNKVAFLVHFSNAQEVRKCGSTIFDNISELAKQKLESPIQLHLRGGQVCVSEETIEAIKIWMKQRDDLPMEIVSEDILDSGMCDGGKSLSIDSRTGEVSEYDPNSNPKSRGLSEFDVMFTLKSAYRPQIRVAYTPKA